MQSLDRDSQLFENDITEETFVKTHGIFVLELFGTQDMVIVRTGTERLDLCQTIGVKYCINLAKSF